MGNGIFRFKHFSVAHDRCAMKVGTDGVLLGALCSASSGNAVDIGCGSGLIALMLAQRSSTLRIDAVEIDRAAAEQAKDNVASSPWSDRIDVYCSDVREWGKDSFYDQVVSNPPYYDNSQSAASAARNVARHSDALNYEQLALASSRLLKVGGILQVIIPQSEVSKFVDEAWLAELNLSAQVSISTKRDKPPMRSVLTFVKKHAVAVPLHSSICLMNADSTHSDEYQELTKDFYL